VSGEAHCVACGEVLAAAARYCHACGTKVIDVAERERRLLSAVFIDMVGFSALTHALDPEPLRDLADSVLSEVAAVVEAYDGHVDAFRGDGVIALFGATTAHADDPLRALRAARDALEAIRRIGRGRGIDTRARAGVATGVSVVGFVGGGRMRSHTAMGSSVNLASRLENAAGAGEVWVDAVTATAASHAHTFERIEGAILPGFPTTTAAYRLLPGIRGGERGPWLGRGAARERLDAAWARVVASGRAERIALIGPSGSGKSRLLDVFAASIPAQALRLHHAPLAPFDWRDLACELLGTSERAAWRAAFERLLPGQERWQKALAISVGLDEAPSWNRLERRRIDRTLLAWRDLLLAVAARERRPMLIAIDGEPHDPRLRSLAALLAEATAPLLIVTTHRSAATSASDHVDHAEQTEHAVRLNALSTAEAAALYAQLGGGAWPPDVAAFPGEVVTTAAVALAGGDVTAPIARSLQRRIAALPAAARRLLTAVALAGPGGVVPLALLEALAEEPSAVATLMDAGVLRADLETVAFSSERLREAVIATSTALRRRQLHQRIAAWWEQHGGEIGAREAAWHHGAIEGVATT
jgi:class 3 adenylate cyclase/energy-coupling factor transporter ATP-binding protein EcfA2